MKRCLSLVAVLAAVVGWLVGCSDDVVCPLVDELFVSGRVLEYNDGAQEITTARVFCSADPLPIFFVARVNDLELTELPPSGPGGFEAGIEMPTIIWQSGTQCSLKVSTNLGFTTGLATVPGAFSVDAPDSVSLGDTLMISWRPSDYADFYTVSLTIVSDTRGDTVLISTDVADTVASFSNEITIAGEMRGHVAAVSGPMIGGGSTGNVNDNGWGFFTVSYYDTASMFSCVVRDTLRR